jgi:phosphoribosylformylglycinamidine cyclo-ligase
MFSAFNMGIGFVIVVAAAEVEKALELLRSLGEKPWIAGRAVRDPQRSLVLPGPKLVGSGKTFWTA